MTPELEPNASPAGPRPTGTPGLGTIPEIDALRGIAIVAVSGLHVSFGFLIAAPPNTAAAAWALGVHLLTGYGTPLFVMLSMVGLALGYERPAHAGGSEQTFLARRIRRILPPYLLWTVLTVLRNDPGSLLHPWRMLGLLLSGGAAYHLYFVPLICEYYLLWPLLSRLAVAARRSTRAALVIAAGGLVASLAVWHAASAGLISNRLLTLPLFWLGYATLGLATAPALAHYFSDRRRARLSWAPLAAFTALSALVMVRHVRALVGPAPDVQRLAIITTIFQTPTMLYTLAAMTLAVALVGGAARGTGLLQALGRRSYGVYLGHVLVLEVVLQRVFGRPSNADFTSPAWLVEMLIEWAGCLILTYGLVCILERTPGLAGLAGTRPMARADATAPNTR